MLGGREGGGGSGNSLLSEADTVVLTSSPAKSALSIHALMCVSSSYSNMSFMKGPAGEGQLYMAVCVLAIGESP